MLNLVLFPCSFEYWATKITFGYGSLCFLIMGKNSKCNSHYSGIKLFSVIVLQDVGVFVPQVIAESLSEEEIAGLKEMFKAMDTDNSGAITFDELKAGLRKYGSTLKDIEIRDLMDAVRVIFLIS